MNDDGPDPPPPAVLRRSRFGLGLQFFVVPAAIVAVCAAGFFLFRFMTEETQTLQDLFERTTKASGHPKSVYAESFVRRLKSERGDFSRPASEELYKLAPRILDAADGLGGRALSEEESRARKTFLHALAIIGNPTVAPEVGRILDEEERSASRDESLQWECLQTLGALRNPESLQAIRKYLDHPSRQIRKHAAFNLAALGDVAAVPDLKRKLPDESTEVQWNAAFGLAYFLKDSSGVAVLLSMLDRERVRSAVPPNDPEREFFIANAMAMSAQALAVVKERSAVELLQRAADKDPSIEVQKACRNALRAIRE